MPPLFSALISFLNFSIYAKVINNNCVLFYIFIFEDMYYLKVSRFSYFILFFEGFACMHVCRPHACQELIRPEEGIRFPATRAIDGCEPPGRG